MKNKTILIALIALCIFLSGCHTLRNGSDGYSSVEYRKININLNLNKYDLLTCCYCLGSQMILSISTDKPSLDQSPAQTRELIVYDYEKEKVVNSFSITSQNYISEAIPYKDGLVYAAYQWDMNKGRPALKWKIKYIDHHGQKTVDQGYCRDKENIPALSYLKGSPAYAYEEGNDSKYEFGVKIIQDMTPKTILIASADTQRVSSIFPTNGEEFVLMVKVKDDKYATCIIGDETGELKRVRLKEKLISYGINEANVLIGLGTDDNRFQTLTIDLKNDTPIYANVDVPAYRITGGPGESFMSVDGDFGVYTINAGNKTPMVKLDWPENLTTDPIVFYYPVSEGKYIATFDMDKLFYQMTVN